MPDMRVLIYCHLCGHWSGPSTANDGTRRRCTNCKRNVMVIRYPERHPLSKIGCNVKPYQEPEPLHGGILARTQASPTIKPTRKTLTGTIVSREDEALASANARVARKPKPVIEESAYVPNQRDTTYDAHTPTSLVFCIECQEGNFKPNGRTYGIADYEVTLVYGNQPVAKPLCKQHTEAHARGFIMPRPARIQRFTQPPPPKYGYTEITR